VSYFQNLVDELPKDDKPEVVFEHMSFYKDDICGLLCFCEQILCVRGDLTVVRKA
jgi:hypothetical protein